MEILSSYEGYGDKIYGLIKRLFPICRSITGQGTQKSLEIIKELVPLEIFKVRSGRKIFDWQVPREWNINDAFIKNERGRKIVDFKKSNLHVLNYSVPVHKKVKFQELKEHLFSLPNQPDAIPYLTSYYKEDWGFCLTHRQFRSLKKNKSYEVYIGSSFKDGHLKFGEYYKRGETKDEFLFSTYICHPSLCNDNLSGPALLAFVAEFLKNIKTRYSYRFLFVPETIGAIAWLAMNRDILPNIKYGLIVTCVGDKGCLTYKKTRVCDAPIDKIACKVLSDSKEKYKIVDFSPAWGSDERQFSSPAFNLPLGSLMRTMYGCFSEYHTSKDNLDFVRAKYLGDSFEKYMRIIETAENNFTYLNLNPECEPHLGKRGLYRNLGSRKISSLDEMSIFWVLNYSDGKNSLLDISVRSHLPFINIKNAADLLYKAGLLKILDS